MGRIETEGMTLVDQKESKKLLNCSRATFFRKIQAGDLVQIHLAGTRTVYVTLESIERYLKRGPQFALRALDDDKERAAKEKEMNRFFPQIMSQSSLDRDDS